MGKLSSFISLGLKDAKSFAASTNATPQLFDTGRTENFVFCGIPKHLLESVGLAHDLLERSGTFGISFAIDLSKKRTIFTKSYSVSLFKLSPNEIDFVIVFILMRP